MNFFKFKLATDYGINILEKSDSDAPNKIGLIEAIWSIFLHYSHKNYPKSGAYVVFSSMLWEKTPSQPVK